MQKKERFRHPLSPVFFPSRLPLLTNFLRIFSETFCAIYKYSFFFPTIFLSLSLCHTHPRTHTHAKYTVLPPCFFFTFHYILNNFLMTASICCFNYAPTAIFQGIIFTTSLYTVFIKLNFLKLPFCEHSVHILCPFSYSIMFYIYIYKFNNVLYIYICMYVCMYVFEDRAFRDLVTKSDMRS